MNDAQQRAAAKAFVKQWENKGFEKGESQPFWLSLLRDVYGVEHPEQFIHFETKVHLDHTSFIDGYIPSTRVLIEQKSADKKLNAPIKQSDGSLLTPFQQAKRYITELPVSKHPRWVITCNFNTFYVYDMERPTGEPEQIKLKDLPKEFYRLSFLVDNKNTHLEKELAVSIKAGDLVGQLYDSLLAQYIDKNSPQTHKSLNVLCVRLVFCLYAEDAGLFGRKGMFHDYLQQAGTRHMRSALIELFRVLDTPANKRDAYLEDDLAAFPYVNGGLFADENIEIPQFTDKIYDLLVNKASHNFDWAEISPTIFGAVFESTLNPQTRRKGGMHYTSIENIHKVIDPLFLNDLHQEFEEICAGKILTQRNKKLLAFQEKLASLLFLDPACGSGNFLTETYLSLRRLENKLLEKMGAGKIYHDMSAIFNPIKVSIGQFYGIEINDFAVTVAKTALWIAESQMFKATQDLVHTNLDFLPLKTYANIAEGNALRMDWGSLVPKEKLSYIMGNPPFIGARLMNEAQKADVLDVFGPKWKNVGNLDYVCCWYKKAADLMQGTTIRAALVSTNSISQGEQVAILWKPLFEQGLHFDFAYRTFRWDSEATQKAHVHCVIIGFSFAKNNKEKLIFTSGKPLKVKEINGYLLEAAPIFIESRTLPLCPVPPIGIGNKPIDGGNYLFTAQEKKDFIKKEPAAADYFHPWYGAEEFIQQKPRYCLWLGNCPPDKLRQMPLCLERVENVRKLRLTSKSIGTRKLAERPTHFHVENMANKTYIIIPKVSTISRIYIPMGFMSPKNMASDLVFVMQNANLFHFGILQSNVHMAWMRTTCGRLGISYRYSKDIVYNNFPWPSPTPEQERKIMQTAQGILDARALYPSASLADLYDDLTMPPELRTAHQQNDRAVMEAYGLSVKNTTESTCVAHLMELYQQLTKSK